MTGRRPEALGGVVDAVGGEPFVCDLADLEALGPLLEAAASVDILVANAALPATGRLDSFTVEEIDRAPGCQPAGPSFLPGPRAAP